MIFDSPCKTSEEIREALQLGVNININSLSEIEKISTEYLSLVDKEAYVSGSSFIGLRVNPLVGAGNLHT